MPKFNVSRNVERPSHAATSAKEFVLNAALSDFTLPALSHVLEGLYADIDVLEFAVRSVHHVSRCVHYHVHMGLVRQNVEKNAGLAEKNVHGNVIIKNALRSVLQNAIEPNVQVSAVKP